MFPMRERRERRSEFVVVSDWANRLTCCMQPCRGQTYDLLAFVQIGHVKQYRGESVGAQVLRIDCRVIGAIDGNELHRRRRLLVLSKVCA
jgi:hypothetical protein